MDQANQIRDDDSLLDEFFAEIENLKIEDENVDKEDEGTNSTAASEIDGNHAPKESRRKKPSSQKRQERKTMIDRAETTRSNWKKFVIEGESESFPASPLSSATGRKPISFSIGAANGKKKKSSKCQSKITRHRREEKLLSAFGDDIAPSSSRSPGQQKVKSLLQPHQGCLLLPQWLVILDTCALLESYESVCDIIKLAKNASMSAVRAQNDNQQFWSSEFLVEALTIVVPYTVWDELDYRSKVIDDEDQKYKARRAIRMLNEELHVQNDGHELNQGMGNQISASTSSSDALTTPFIRSQSRIESHRAVEEFVLFSPVSNEKIVSNDDKILACALWEKDRVAKARAPAIQGNPAAVGVVLITFDKVLTGKARADHLTVYSPFEFVQYYNKRMVSLRSRTRRPSGRGLKIAIRIEE